MLITTIVLRKENNINSDADCGIALSMMEMSFENLFRTLPDGVVSKNDIGSHRMFNNSRL